MISIGITIGTLTRTYVLAKTNAPARYDAGSVIELHDASYTPPGKDRVIERYILVESRDLEWQRGRNFSGIYTLITDPEELIIDSRDVARELWKRFYPEAA